MTRDESMDVSAAIGRIIATSFPAVPFTEDEIAAEMALYSKEELDEMKELGLTPDGFRTFYVIRKFCDTYGIDRVADAEYMLELYGNARRIPASFITDDPYMKAADYTTVKDGDVTLTWAEYARGEIFQYDMPNVNGRLVVPKLGFFDTPVRFPALYEGDMPWVSVIPSEINSMREQLDAAEGRCLVLGLGLGYYAFHAAMKESVTSVTVVELNEKITDIFVKHLLPKFPCRDKIKIIRGDAVAYAASLTGDEYDFCFADIWEGAVDGAPHYVRLRESAKRLPDIRFTYWIEEQIKEYLGE